MLEEFNLKVSLDGRGAGAGAPSRSTQSHTRPTCNILSICGGKNLTFWTWRRPSTRRWCWSKYWEQGRDVLLFLCLAQESSNSVLPQSFDEALVLERGGRVVFSGALGERSSLLIQHLQVRDVSKHNLTRASFAPWERGPACSRTTSRCVGSQNESFT